MNTDVVVVGAGLAGLACARRLHAAGLSFRLYERANHVGGRVATDEHEGFLLDRGFQVLLSSYPEVSALIDLADLDARAFAAGSLVQLDGRAWRVVDPWRSPLAGLKTLRAPFVSLRDGLRMARFRQSVLEDAFQRVETAQQHLERRGFSEALIERFFRPFFAGVTLDRSLSIPASYLRFLFAMFATGDALLPARGMRALPEAIAAPLPEDAVVLGADVTAVDAHGVTLDSGERVGAKRVVVAGARPAANLGVLEQVEWNGTVVLYHAAERSPVDEPLLVLDGAGDGPVNHLCVPSDVQPTYAPAGASLVSSSLVGAPNTDDGELDAAARAQLTGWFGDQVAGWRLLRVVRVPRALPSATQEPASRLVEGVHVCGDQTETPSIQGALVSGRRAAEDVLAALGEPVAADA